MYSPTPKVCISGLTIEYNSGSAKRSKVAVADFDMEIGNQEFVCLLGPSGCGKSTVLNAVAGFIQPRRGSVTVDGRKVTAPGPDRGVVFQDANIFPWMTVEKNVAAGPRFRGERRTPELRRRVHDMISAVKLTGFEKHLPLELSGGMRQRVGLARTLVNEPDMLLMDEPFGSLDAQTRIIMQELLLELWERDKKTVLFITHDLDEALLLGDRVVVMSAAPGRVKTEHIVDFERPRHYAIVASSEFQKVKQELFEVLHVEAERAELGEIRSVSREREAT